MFRRLTLLTIVAMAFTFVLVFGIHREASADSKKVSEQKETKYKSTGKDMDKGESESYERSEYRESHGGRGDFGEMNEHERNELQRFSEQERHEYTTLKPEWRTEVIGLRPE